MDQNNASLMGTERIDELARENYRFFLKSEELMLLFYAIDQWYRAMKPDFSFVAYVIELIKHSK